jgi:GPH family glycoside/pentoside/hexuronide:cation symporter/probable glucitol transport protein GutA
MYHNWEETPVKRSEIAGHAIAGAGQNLIFGFWNTYMLIFLTDVYGISGGIAGIILMTTRIWDAVNDPVMGVIADRTRTRWGRYRPWLLFTAIPVVLFLILNFSTPNFGYTGKIIYAFAAYIFMSMIYTAVDVPYWSLPAAMTHNTAKRTAIFSISRPASTFSLVLTSVIAIPLINIYGRGDTAKGYRYTAVVLGIIGASFLLLGFLFVREHITPPQKKKFRLKEAINVIIQNKPLLLLLSSMIITFSCINIRLNMFLYFIQYNLDSRDFVPLFTLIMLPGMLLGVFLTSKLSRKTDRKKLFILACFFGGIANLIFFFVGYSNIILVGVMFFITAIPTGFTMVLMPALIADTIEYAEWKTGNRCEGLIISTQTFATKICIAIAGGISGLALSFSHYSPNMVQSGLVLAVFHACITIIMAAGMLIGIIPMLFNKLTDKRYAEILTELEQRKK